MKNMQESFLEKLSFSKKISKIWKSIRFKSIKRNPQLKSVGITKWAGLALSGTRLSDNEWMVLSGPQSFYWRHSNIFKSYKKSEKMWLHFHGHLIGQGLNHLKCPRVLESDILTMTGPISLILGSAYLYYNTVLDVGMILSVILSVRSLYKPLSRCPISKLSTYSESSWPCRSF